VRLVVEGTIIVIVPLITSFLLNTLTLLTPVVCISVVDDVAQISVIPILLSAVFLRWSETAGRVPTQTLSVVQLMIPYFAVTIEGRVNHGSCV
jgi:hypothetical protein